MFYVCKRILVWGQLWYKIVFYANDYIDELKASDLVKFSKYCMFTLPWNLHILIYQWKHSTSKYGKTDILKRNHSLIMRKMYFKSKQQSLSIRNCILMDLEVLPLSLMRRVINNDIWLFNNLILVYNCLCKCKLEYLKIGLVDIWWLRGALRKQGQLVKTVHLYL